MESFPIDIVYLWCDSSDINWLKKKNQALGSGLDEDAVSDCRFVNNDELKYSLRSLEKYAPWINNIFIVTDNQVPKWLDTSNPKIHIVDHSEILPSGALPIFNSAAIETALHKIPGLSEHFLFANDDMFFGAPVSKSFFYVPDGRPIFRFSGRRIINKPYRHLYGYMISHAYKLAAEKYGRFNAYFPHHNIDAYRKSDIEKCYEEFQEGFEQTARQKFREKECIQRSIFGYYSIAKGLAEHKVIRKFSKNPPDSVMFKLEKSKLKLIEKKKPYLFCINDSLRTTDEDRLTMKDFLRRQFPEQSSFEKQYSKDVQIYICYHKESQNYLKSDAVFPVQVGAALSEVDLGIAKDSDGENISCKNKNYCELTALYQLWKNSNADYAGLMHYRRLFDLSCRGERWFNCFPENVNERFLLNRVSVCEILADFNVIVPMKRVIQQAPTAYEYYKKRHFISDLDRTLEIIKEKYPQFYETAADILKNSNKLYLYNMFIASKDFLNDYAAWLFDILGILETEIQSDVETRDIFQQRVYGFLAERLFTVYIEYCKKQGMRIKEVPVVYCEGNKKRYDVFQFRTKVYKILAKFGLRRPHWKEQYGV